MTLQEILTDTYDEAATFWTSTSTAEEGGHYSSVERIGANETENLEILFLRDYVAKNKPCIIENLGEFCSWKLMSQLDTLEKLEAYLKERSNPVEVNVTPNGLADSITTLRNKDGSTRNVFMKPHVQKIVITVHV